MLVLVPLASVSVSAPPLARGSMTVVEEQRFRGLRSRTPLVVSTLSNSILTPVVIIRVDIHEVVVAPSICAIVFVVELARDRVGDTGWRSLWLRATELHAAGRGFLAKRGYCTWCAVYIERIRTQSARGIRRRTSR